MMLDGEGKELMSLANSQRGLQSVNSQVVSFRVGLLKPINSQMSELGGSSSSHCQARG